MLDPSPACADHQPPLDQGRGKTAAWQLPAVHSKGWDSPTTWCHSLGANQPCPCSAHVCLNSCWGWRWSQSTCPTVGSPAVSSLLFLARPHHLSGPSVALGLPILSQQDTKGSCCLSRLLTLCPKSHPIVTHPTDRFLWLPMLPWVLPEPSPSCPCSPSGLPSLHLGQDPGGSWPCPSVKFISHIPSLHLLLPYCLLLHHHILLFATSVVFPN